MWRRIKLHSRPPHTHTQFSVDSRRSRTVLGPPLATRSLVDCVRVCVCVFFFVFSVWWWWWWKGQQADTNYIYTYANTHAQICSLLQLLQYVMVITISPWSGAPTFLNWPRLQPNTLLCPDDHTHCYFVCPFFVCVCKKCTPVEWAAGWWWWLVDCYARGDTTLLMRATDDRAGSVHKLLLIIITIFIKHKLRAPNSSNASRHFL